MKNNLKIYWFVILFIIACIICFGVYQYDKKTVNDWATSNGYQIEDITTKIWPFGTPFYYVNKGEYIFKVEMKNHDIWWVRTNRWYGNEYIKQK